MSESERERERERERENTLIWVLVPSMKIESYSF